MPQQVLEVLKEAGGLTCAAEEMLTGARNRKEIPAPPSVPSPTGVLLGDMSPCNRAPERTRGQSI